MPEPIRDRNAVTTYLDSLGLNAPLLRGAVEEGVKLHLFQCTKNDPAPGIIGWIKVTRAMRDRLLPLGWKRRRVNRQPVTLNPKTNVGIVVSTGDEFTGTDTTPSTRHPKGPATSTAINVNVRSFADVDPDFAATVPKVAELMPRSLVQTWMLLFFVDRVAHEIRVELSLPKRMDASHMVSEWYERVIIDAIKFDDDDLLGDIDDDDDDDEDGIAVEWIG